MPNILARFVESRKIKIKPFEEDRLCKNNLRIDGVNEEKGETWAIKNIFQKKLEIQEDIIMERAHITKGETTRNNIAGKNSQEQS